MKNSTLKYILIVSLLLNISLLGAAAHTYYKQVRYYRTAPIPGPGGSPGPRAPCGPVMLFEGLSLKPEQMKLFREKAALFHDGIMKKRREVDSLGVSLLDLMRADSPDDRAIGATIAHINNIQEDIQKNVVSHMLEFKSMLDKDQQSRFLDMVGGAMTQRKETMCP